MSVALRLEELLARLPGTVRRGHAPPVRAGRDECLPTGLGPLDEALDGGIPRACLSEVQGSGSSGITSLALRIAAGAVARGEWVAWVDAADAFDPGGSLAAGLDPESLLWVRPPDLRVALAAAEQLLVLGGFALVVLDVSPPVASPAGPGSSGRSPAASSGGRRTRAREDARLLATGHPWTRLARASSRARTALLALRRDGGSSSAASLRLEMRPAEILWDRRGGAPAILEGLRARVLVRRRRGSRMPEGEITLRL
ncbi:hypothetical protein KGQ64_07250 [bacterium]|nr:hypothetical protein [bacterium]